jgi:EPS-associated MarR family transcriptional regulator
MNSRRSQIRDGICSQGRRALLDNPDATQREIAEGLGLSTTGLSYRFEALTEKGWIKMRNFSQPKISWAHICVLTPQGISESAALMKRFIDREMNEYEAPWAEIKALKMESTNKSRADQSGGRP